jgi:hypothetical protein
MDENIPSAADRLFGRHGHYGQSGAQTLQAGGDDEFASRKAFSDYDRPAYRRADFHTPDDRLSVLDNENVNPLLIRN